MSQLYVCLVCSQILDAQKTYTDALLICDCGKSMYDLVVNKAIGFLWAVDTQQDAEELSKLSTMIKHHHLHHYEILQNEVGQLQSLSRSNDI